MEKSQEDIGKEIIKFLDDNSTKKGGATLPGCGLRHGIACALGTCRDNMPRVTPVDFFNDGLTLWVLADPGGKLGNIRSNPNVAVGIFTRMDHARENRSIQLWGKAHLVTMRHQEGLFMETVKKFGILDAIQKAVREGMINVKRDEDFEAAVNEMLSNETLIRIEPDEITFLIIRSNEKPEKLHWKRVP